MSNSAPPPRADRGSSEVAWLVLRQGLAAVRAQAAMVLGVERDAGCLTLLAEEGYPPGATEAMRRIALDASWPASEAARAGSPVLVESPDELRERYPTVGIIPAVSRAFACLPLTAEATTVGVLTLSFAAPKRFTAEEKAFMEALANLGGLALERALARDAERLAERRARFLAEASHVLAASLEHVPMLEAVASLAVPELADGCAVELLEEGESTRRMVASRNRDPEKVALAYELRERFPPDPDAPVGVSRVLATGQGELHEDVSEELLAAAVTDEEHLRIVRSLGLRSAMIVPICARGRTFGAITFVSSRDDRRYGQSDLAFATDFGQRVGLAVDNLRLVQELEAEKARLGGILASAMDAIVTIDQQERIVLFNAAAETMFRCSAAEALGKPLSTFVPERFRAAHHDHVRRFAETGATKRSMGALGTVWGRRMDGGEFPIEATISRVVNRGHLLHTVILRDVTERLAQQRALEDAARQKDQFLAMLGHELRNPLAAIQNAVELSRTVAPQADPTLLSAREIVARQVTHMARLIDDLLDVSRIARGKVELRREPLDLREIVRVVVSDRQSAAGVRGVSVAAELPDRPAWVHGDRARLVQVLDNLIDNALKFTDAGGSVVATLRTGDEGHVLEVRDTGVGMTPEVAAQVFEPFRQADTSLGRASGGLGLGLSLVRGLVQLHGGTVIAQSAGDGRGSTFVVSLPCAEAPRAVADRPPGVDEAVEARRVLIVEDNEDSAELLRAILVRIGLDAEVAHTGREALAAFSRRRPDVVLCDVGLPGDMTGYDVARQIRRGSGPGVALVAITGYGRPEDRDRALAAGFDAHLTKPVDLARLRRTIAEVVARRSA